MLPVAESLLFPALYAGCLSLLAVYGAHRLWMLRRFNSIETPAAATPPEALPRITVQLPVYNERAVAARVIAAAGALDYPSDRIQIQVLDDSGDDTCKIVDQAVAALCRQGLDAVVVRRTERTGFKAGALDAGMLTATGELVCIFDADFMPRPEFLRQLVPHIQDPKVGCVQARWSHENRDESALTRAQATLLDGHFVIEHKVRHDAGLFFNFNGTAGIWRRAAIRDAGGWQTDTLTEDLDLSYRAQLAGWRFVYAPEVVSPAELPQSLAAFKTQQHRWAKGSAQVLKKLAKRIYNSSTPLPVRLEAFIHLSSNVGYPLVFALSLLLPVVHLHGPLVGDAAHLAIFVLCTLSVMLFYERGQRALGRGVLRRLGDTLLAMSLGIGLCVSQSGAVFAGLFGTRGVFERTPKRGGYRALARGLPGIELTLALWLGWAAVCAARAGLWGSLPFLALFTASFLWVGGLSLWEALAVQVGSSRRFAKAQSSRRSPGEGSRV